MIRKEAKREFSQLRPMQCKYCGKVIWVNMYRHVARLHLDLVQLCRCLIAWCTMWRGSPQDCLEHLRNGHDVPWISNTASIEDGRGATHRSARRLHRSSRTMRRMSEAVDDLPLLTVQNPADMVGESVTGFHTAECFEPQNCGPLQPWYVRPIETVAQT